PLFISDSHAVEGKVGEHRTYRFFQVDQQPALPASSLRGMVCSVFEAVTNSCFVVFDEQSRLSYRDVIAARRMKPGIVKTLATDGAPGRIALCKEAAVGAYPGSKKPILLDSSWRTGEKALAVIHKPKKGVPFVTKLGKTGSEFPQAENVVEGRLKITGANIDTKLNERFFYQPDIDECRWVEFDLERQEDYNEILSQQFKEPGFSSTHQHTMLTPDDLVYVELEENNRTVRNIAATKVPRLRYRTAIGKLLQSDHLHRCKNPDTLCPACRVFGWVWDSPPKEADRVAYAGRVRFSHGVLTHSAAELPETTLAILSTPKPTTTPFYLLNSEGQPDATVNYDTDGARLRGRKFYRYQGQANPDEYQRNEASDQNRTVRSTLLPGATFTFTLDFENLAPLELGALLYALELEEGMFHRLGYAKPLGFGSVKVTVESVQILDWETRLQSLEQDAGWQPIDGTRHKQEFLERCKIFTERGSPTYWPICGRCWKSRRHCRFITPVRQSGLT
ncbi:MAG: TIGR03986 family CRISPR-associated RAMP protein, partial [Deltaproteobacteria bacterium]|nr:TIGR03986 family CRISPR-associated RAMP protein [Deltaproteobacteria bacterium]